MSMMNIRQGTTPYHRFEIPVEEVVIEKVRITYAQEDNVILTKENEECTINGNIVETHLTQEDTLLFDERKKAQVQVHIVTDRGEALTSDILYIACWILLGKQVLK